MSKSRTAAALPSKRTLKRLPKLSKAAVKMLVRVHEGVFYPVQFPATGAMKELVDGGLVKEMGRAALIKLCYVPRGAKPMVLEKIPKLPNWLHAVYVAQSFDHIARRVKKSKADDPPKA